MGINRIAQPISSLTQRNLNAVVSENFRKAIESISSGLRVRRAADDASGLTVAKRLQARFASLSQALANAQDSLNVANVADQSLDETSNRLLRIRELAIQASNTGVYDAQARQAMQAEVFQNIDEINRIAETTQFGTNRLLNGDFSAEAPDGAGTFQIGADQDQNIRLVIEDVHADQLGLGAGSTVADIDITTVSGAQTAIGIIDAALDEINETRSRIGAFANRVESSADYLGVAVENLTAAHSRIVDADIAAESTRLATAELMMKTNVAVLTQTNNLRNQLFSGLLP